MAINISGCPHRCAGCHSEYLWQNTGEILENHITEILDKYSPMITCICFMGGDQNLDNLLQLIGLIKERYNLKVCVYSGTNDIQVFSRMLDNLDYLKIGSYREELGGLNSPKTNQKFYKVEKGVLQDITHMFYNKEGDN